MRYVACLMLLLAGPVAAQVRPMRGAGDPRLQTAIYDPNQVLQLPVAAGYQLTVELSPDETVQTAAIGDGGGWQVTASKRGNSLFIRSDTSARMTNLSVTTTNRTYAFQLIPMSSQSPDAPFRVQFVYPGAVTVAPSVLAPTRIGQYKLSGDKAVRPSAITDDGQHTYIEWREDQALPATFVIDETGQEVLADGYMRSGKYVVDSVREKLVFRLDRQVARADRITPKGK